MVTDVAVSDDVVTFASLIPAHTSIAFPIHIQRLDLEFPHLPQSHLLALVVHWGNAERYMTVEQYSHQFLR